MFLSPTFKEQRLSSMAVYGFSLNSREYCVDVIVISCLPSLCFLHPPLVVVPTLVYTLCQSNPNSLAAHPRPFRISPHSNLPTSPPTVSYCIPYTSQTLDRSLGNLAMPSNAPALDILMLVFQSD